MGFFDTKLKLLVNFDRFCTNILHLLNRSLVYPVLTFILLLVSKNQALVLKDRSAPPILSSSSSSSSLNFPSRKRWLAEADAPVLLFGTAPPTTLSMPSSRTR